MLDRMERIERPQEFQEMQFEFNLTAQSGVTVLSTQKLVVGYGRLMRREQGEANSSGSLEQAREPLALARVAGTRPEVVDRSMVAPAGTVRTTVCFSKRFCSAPAAMR